MFFFLYFHTGDSPVAVSHLLLLICQFIEKRREMKQEGRTEQELSESFCFLYPDKSKVLMKSVMPGCCCLVL